MNPQNLADERKDYRKGHLLESETPAEPLALFTTWMADALTHAEEATAMALATTDNGRPSCRIVLLKGVEEGAFVFYTNYDSRKGHELTHNPYAAATFYWSRLERQVRIEGKVEPISRERSEAYFHSRPLESQISASVSPQSQKVENRSVLEQLWQNRQDQLHGEQPAMPQHWGGYALVPDRIEFWQGGAGRLHDRIVYDRIEAGWAKSRLAP